MHYGYINEAVVKKYGIGELKEIPNNEYHKIPALSSSDIKTMATSIDMVSNKGAYIRGESPAMQMGTALHEALLEPDKFRISAYRMKPADISKLKIMMNNSRLVFGKALAGARAEVSFLSKDDIFLKKCRPDAYNEQLGIVFDVKTSRYGDINSFHRYDINAHNYDIQAAWYLDVLKSLGLNADHFVFLVVQNQSPYNCFSVEVHNSVIEKGRARYSELLEKYDNYCTSEQVLDIRTVFDYDFLKSLTDEEKEELL